MAILFWLLLQSIQQHEPLKSELFRFFSPLPLWSRFYISFVSIVPDLFNLNSFLSSWFSVWSITPALSWWALCLVALRLKGAQILKAPSVLPQTVCLSTDTFRPWDSLPISVAVLSLAHCVFQVNVCLLFWTHRVCQIPHCFSLPPLGQMLIPRGSCSCWWFVITCS